VNRRRRAHPEEKDLRRKRVRKWEEGRSRSYDLIQSCAVEAKLILAGRGKYPPEQRRVFSYGWNGTEDQ